MTKEDALIKVKGYLTDYLPIEDSNQIDEILEALNPQSIMDYGIVLKNSDGLYYCGLNAFDKQLRKAKIYHSDKWADEAIESIMKSTNYKFKTIKRDFIKVNVEIKEINGEKNDII